MSTNQIASNYCANPYYSAPPQEVRSSNDAHSLTPETKKVHILNKFERQQLLKARQAYEHIAFKEPENSGNKINLLKNHIAELRSHCGWFQQLRLESKETINYMEKKCHLTETELLEKKTQLLEMEKKLEANATQLKTQLLEKETQLKKKETLLQKSERQLEERNMELGEHKILLNQYKRKLDQAFDMQQGDRNTKRKLDKLITKTEKQCRQIFLLEKLNASLRKQLEEMRSMKRSKREPDLREELKRKNDLKTREDAIIKREEAMDSLEEERLQLHKKIDSLNSEKEFLHINLNKLKLENERLFEAIDLNSLIHKFNY